MSKTFVYTLLVIGVYVLVIFPMRNKSTNKNEKKEETEPKADTNNGTGLNENADKNGVSQGAAGRMKYQFGYTQ